MLRLDSSKLNNFLSSLISLTTSGIYYGGLVVRFRFSCQDVNLSAHLAKKGIMKNKLPTIAPLHLEEKILGAKSHVVFLS